MICERETLRITCGSVEPGGTQFDLCVPLPFDSSTVIAKLGRRGLQISTKSGSGKCSNSTTFHIPMLDSRVVSREHASFSVTRSLLSPVWCVTAHDLGSKHGVFHLNKTKISKEPSNLRRGETACFLLGAGSVSVLPGYDTHHPVVITVSVLRSLKVSSLRSG